MPEVTRENYTWELALYLAGLMYEAGGFFVIEHPRSSRAWELRVTEMFVGRGVSCKHKVEWCAFSDVGNQHISLKPAILFSNCPWVSGVVKSYPGERKHEAPKEDRVFESAKGYPWGFCRALAHAGWAWATGSTA